MLVKKRSPILFESGLSLTSSGFVRPGISRVLFETVITLVSRSPWKSCGLPERGIAPGRRSAPMWPCSGWGFPCPRCRQRGGGLLPRLFTLAPSRSRERNGAVCFLWHSSVPPTLWLKDREAFPLGTTLPYGARTFLSPGLAGERPSARPDRIIIPRI